MVRLAAFPKCYIEDISEGRMCLFDWIEMAAELPVDGMELYDKFLTERTSSYLAKVRQAIESKGRVIAMMCYSPDFTIPDRAEREKEIAKQKDIIQVTAELGGEYCRTLSGQRRPEVSVEDGTRWVVECIQECLETAEKCKVVISMENHYKDPFWKYPEFAQKSEPFIAIIERIDSPFFGVQYDPSNMTMAGEDPVEFLRKVKHRVKTMHASDRYLVPGATLDDLKLADGTIGYPSKLCHGVIGKGINDYDTIFRILREEEFNGWISIEDGVNGLDEIRESAEFLRRKMKVFETPCSPPC